MLQALKLWIANLFTFRSYYESEDVLINYIKCQYGAYFNDKRYLLSEDFYKNIITESKPYIGKDTVALDVGCALGRLVFEFDKLGAKGVLGIDKSANFIKFANSIKNSGGFGGFRCNNQEGRSEFLVADIMRPSIWQNDYFDFISCVNLLDRVENPETLIKNLGDILKPGGILMLVDPYDWQYSPAPKRFHIDDMKTLLETHKWIIQKEVRNLPFKMPISESHEIDYKCHLVIAKKNN